MDLICYDFRKPVVKVYACAHFRFFVALLFILSSRGSPLFAQTSHPSFYVEAGSYGTKRESDPPDYVRRVSPKLELGFALRSRFEFRQNDIRRPELTTDKPLLLKTRFFAGYQTPFSPLKLVAELQDSRRFNGKFPEDDRDFNRMEFIQSYAELRFQASNSLTNTNGPRPVFLRFGRQAFEFLDRRLIGSNQWRNTTNTFFGFRGGIGTDASAWQLDVLALRPIIRKPDAFDDSDPNRFFGAVIGHWRKNSRLITLEPFYLVLKQRSAPENANRARFIHSPGIRLYGFSPGRALNYDFSATFQTGSDNGLAHRAFMLTAETGYRWNGLASKPRLSAFYGYVSGDKQATDDVSNRFERFFGFARPWSADDYIIPENVITPKIRLEMEPKKGFRFDCGYSFYWLASASDRFNNLLAGSQNRDVTGNSGRFMGHGFDSRLRFRSGGFLDTTFGYSHFVNGGFVNARQQAFLGEQAAASNFLYVELTFNFVDLFKKNRS